MQAAAALADSRTVVVLCAAWCSSCDVFRLIVDDLRQRQPEIRWFWVDIEDEADLVGDIDIQTFPTLVLADGGRAWFAGPVLPKAEVVERLLRQPPGATPSGSDDDAAFDALLQALRDRPALSD